MADLIEVKKNDQKVVPLADFLALKKGSADREKKLKGQLDEALEQVSGLQSQLDIAKVDVDDDADVKVVRQDLLKRDKELRDGRAKHEKDLTAFAEREKVVKAKELVADYKARGVELDLDTLLGEEDMERKALDQFASHLAEENLSLKTKEPVKPTSFFESTMISSSKKQPKDMTDDEFKQFVKEETTKALSK